MDQSIHRNAEHALFHDPMPSQGRFNARTQVKVFLPHRTGEFFGVTVIYMELLFQIDHD
jgi:hypothetical protein